MRLEEFRTFHYKVVTQDVTSEIHVLFPQQVVGRPKQSKNRATYGIWADDSDDDGDPDSMR